MKAKVIQAAKAAAFSSRRHGVPNTCLKSVS
jgi:hypothetical protein